MMPLCSSVSAAEKSSAIGWPRPSASVHSRRAVTHGLPSSSVPFALVRILQPASLNDERYGRSNRKDLPCKKHFITRRCWQLTVDTRAGCHGKQAWAGGGHMYRPVPRAATLGQGQRDRHHGRLFKTLIQ